MQFEKLRRWFTADFKLTGWAHLDFSFAITIDTISDVAHQKVILPMRQVKPLIE